MEKYNNIITHVHNAPAKSAWARGVKEYALEFIEQLQELEEYEERKIAITEANLLNGAADWKAYSWGGAAEIYDYQIAKRLCTPSEYKKSKGGELPPNSREEWLDVQARALHQACQLVLEAAKC